MTDDINVFLKRLKSIDLLFSTWVLIWSALYLINVTDVNPLFALIIVILGQIYTIFHDTQNLNVVLVVKFILLYFTYVKNSSLYLRDVKVTLYLFLIYFIYLLVRIDTRLVRNIKMTSMRYAKSVLYPDFYAMFL